MFIKAIVKNTEKWISQRGKIQTFIVHTAEHTSSRILLLINIQMLPIMKCQLLGWNEEPSGRIYILVEMLKLSNRNNFLSAGFRTLRYSPVVSIY